MTITEPQPTAKSTSPLAIVGLVLAFLLPLVGAIISLVAIGQTGAGKRGGRGLAIAGAIIGFLGTVIAVIAIIVAVAATNAAVDAGDEALTELSDELQTSFQTKADVDAGTIPDFSGDFQIGAATPESVGTSVEVTITNSADAAYTYTATVAAVSPDGATQYETAYVFVDELAASQSSTQTGSFFSEIPPDAVYELVDYSRTAF